MRLVIALTLGIGLLLLHAAFTDWTTGNLPPASFFAARETVIVIETQVVSGRQNGSLRHIPQVTVLHNSRVTELRGLTPAFYDYSQTSAEAAIRGYAVGETTTVRRVDGAPYADRDDWFSLFAALWLSLFAAFALLAGGALLFVARRAGRRQAAASPGN